MADALDSKSSTARCVGSSPSLATALDLPGIIGFQPLARHRNGRAITNILPLIRCPGRSFGALFSLPLMHRAYLLTGSDTAYDSGQERDQEGNRLRVCLGNHTVER